MKNSVRIPMLAAAMILVACNGQGRPQTAEYVTPAESASQFGQLRVHYNALPTLSLNDAVAREYAVEKNAGQALLVIALRKLANGEEEPVEGEVTATAIDLQGSHQRIALRAVRTGAYTDYIGTFAVTAHDSYRFELKIQAAGRSETLKFQRSF